MNYRSVADLNRDIVRWLEKIPADIDLVVGIPRSGLLAANLLALHRNVNVTDVDGLLAGRCIAPGRRLAEVDLSEPHNVLVMDDSVFSGAQIDSVRARLGELVTPHQIAYAAPYVAPGMEHAVDLFYEVVPTPRIFEWNLLHHHLLATSCVDIDGVLCRDPSNQENDDGPAYEAFLRDTPPIITPKAPLGWLVTCRLEKYRTPTEEWLARHDIRYRDLVMMDLPDKDSRVRLQLHAEFKAHVYVSTGADLFIESSAVQAHRIAAESARPVFCFETRELVRPDHRGIASPAGTDLEDIASQGRRTMHTKGNWHDRADATLSEILACIPPGSSLALADDHRLGIPAEFAGRTVTPFLEHDGQYWGTPQNDADAIAELSRQQDKLGIRYLVLSWPSFWWMSYYPGFHEHVRSSFACVAETEHVVIFDLQQRAAATIAR